MTNRIGRRGAIPEDLVHRDEVLDQAVDVGEDLLARQLQVQQRARPRPRRGDHPPLPREHLLQPPAGDLGEGEETERLTGRRAVDDHRVELARLVVALDLEQAEELVHPGRHRQLLRGDVHHATVGDHLSQPLLHGAPVDLHLALRLNLLAPQALADGSRLGPQRHIERIGEAVRRVRREDDGSQAGGRTAAGRGGGDAGLADAALARVKDDSGRLHERLRLSAGRGSEAEPFRPVLYPARLTEVRDQGDFHLTRIRTPVAVLAIALPIIAIVAGCGGGSSSSSEDPNQVLDQTFNNPTKITSGKLDLSIDGSAEGQQSGNFTATIDGPFQADPSNPTAFPQLDLR